MPGPRNRCIARSDSFRRSWFSKSMLPPRMRAGGRGSSPMIARAVTLLPLPDSPTMPRISPFSRVKETFSMAVTSPLPVRNAVVRSRTSSRLIVAPAWWTDRQVHHRGTEARRFVSFRFFVPLCLYGEFLPRLTTNHVLSLLNPQPRIKHIPQPVAQQVQPQDGDHQCRAG